MRHIGDAELNAGHCCQFEMDDGTRINVLEEYDDMDEHGYSYVSIQSSRRLTIQEQTDAVRAHHEHLIIRVDQPFQELPIVYMKLSRSMGSARQLP